MDEMWNNVRNKCADFDIHSAITQALNVVKEERYWEDVDSASEIECLIRRHFSHTNGDSGIANSLNRSGSPKTDIFGGAKEVLGLTFEMLVQKIDSNHYDARDISEKGLYNWRSFFHNGSEFEAIHITILMFGDENLRTDWSRVLSKAFNIARTKRS
jgi:hypothetical protein